MLELEKQRSEMAADKKALALAGQKARALQKAQELDIPSALIEKFIGETDEATDEGLNSLVSALKPWAETKEKKIRETLLGNVGKPDAGKNANAKIIARADFDRLTPADQMATIKSGAIVQ
jgi:hypothetical protein